MSIYIGNQNYTKAYIGDIQFNKIYIGDQLFYSSYIWDADAISLINRMIASGETPTAGRQIAINNCIISLKSNDLFAGQFDVLVVTRGHGPNSTKMNWIKNNHNALGVNSPTYTEDIGYNTDGSSSILRCQYTPINDAVLFTLNDCCWGFKVGGSITTIGVPGGVSTGNDSYGNVSWYSDPGGAYVRLNAPWSSACPGVPYTIGYNMLSRTSSTALDAMVNDTSTHYSNNGYTVTPYLPASEFYMLTWNHPYNLFPGTTEKFELYYFGKSMTQSKFLIFQTIMNTYFATF
jgi:hypothetical protein